MEKAKLWVYKTKKKKLHIEIEFANGKKMPFPQLKLSDTSLNGSEIEVERKAGRIVLIQVEGKVIFLSQSAPKKPHNIPIVNKVDHNFSHGNNQYEHIKQVRNPAYAPYNFVPLNQKIVVFNPGIPEANKYHTNRNTGWIELEIETLTPLYVRGTLTRDDILASKESKDKPDFFSPADRIRIPGSSLRGMIRNLVEIVSYGKFNFFDDKRLYYRGLADRSNLRDEYQRKMSSYDRRTRKNKYKFSAGILRKTKNADRGEHFEIVSSGNNFKQILKSEAKEKVKAIGRKYQEFEFYKVVDKGKKAYIIVSGYIPGKKRDWLIYSPPQNAEIIKLVDKDIQDYLGDRNRSSDVLNLIEKVRECEKNRKCEEGVPCFYVRWKDKEGNERVSFGHTGFFRLAYEKTIGEHIFEELLKTGKIDFAESIFGNEKTHAGRVYFEDAFLCEGQENPLLEDQIPQILSEPKPTTFQHYLVQTNDEVKQLNHYNSDTVIRGYKMYWHKSGKSWQETDKDTIEKHSTQYVRIQPVKSGTKFKSKIRFENLSDKELGALLFALDLPLGCAHKLGMGKPLGLGSVKITPSLYLSNREMRYRDFFAEWDNQISQEDNDVIQKLKQEFEKYVLKELGEANGKSLWETDRLKELLVMLNVGIGRDLEKDNVTRYMSISPHNEFKNRYVLPKASTIPDISQVQGAMDALKAKPSKIRPNVKYIESIEIEGLWDKYKIEWKLNNDVNVLVGINGIGKTTILELIRYALSDEYNNPEKVKYPPKKLIISFDTKETLEYERNGDIVVCNSKPVSILFPEFVSTFDAPLELEDYDQLVGETTAEQIEKQLSTQLRERIARFLIETKDISDNMSKAYINDFIGLINNEIFVRTDKRIEFVGYFKFTDEWFERLNSEIAISADIRDSLQKLIGSEFFQLDEQFLSFLESKIGKRNAWRLCPHILKYVNFLPDKLPTHAVFRLSDGCALLPEQLSTGEKQILIILFTALILKLRTIKDKNKRYVLIIDEPENSLHLKWQKHLISYIRRLNDEIQIIIATHAPAIIKKGYIEKAFEMKNLRKQMEN